jgi:hypothetical protein
VPDADALARLHALSDEAFGQFAAAVAEALAPEGTVTLAPPSPAGGVDAVVESEQRDHRRLVHVRRQAGPGPATAAVADETDAAGRAGETVSGPAFDVDDLREVLTVGESFDTVVVVVAGAVTPDVRRVAAEAGVRLLDSDALTTFLSRHGVEIPRPESVAERFDRLLERQASEWPPAVRDLASRVLAEIESVAAFDHRIVHADGTTDVDFLSPRRDDTADGRETPERATGAPPGRPADPVVRVRLSERECRVYVVDGDDQFERVAALSAIRDKQPTSTELLDDVLPAVRSAVERRE